jgi:hypothetical protein
VKLVLEILSDDGETVAHRLISSFPFTVGRGYHNDIILPDPHVGERHLTIDFDGVAWTLIDHGSVNPTMLNTKPVRSVTAKLCSGDILRAGATTLRVFSADHPVEQPVKMQKTNPVFLHLTRPFNVWTYFLLAIAGVTGWTYATVWSEDTGLTLAGASAAAAVVIFIWATLWSVAGRLIRRRSFFLAHLAMMSLYIALGSLVACLSASLDFLLSENWTALAAGYAMNGALLGFLVYGGLSLSTLMKKRRRLAAALFFSAGITLGILGVSMAQADKFSGDPGYPYRLMPFLERFASADTVDDFMSDSADIFSSDTFNSKKSQK